MMGASRLWRISIAILSLYISGGHGNIEKEHFQEHKWLINVFSVGYYTPGGCLFGHQIWLQMNGAWAAKKTGRVWIAPTFILQPRISKLIEEMIDNGTAVANQHPFVITTMTVPCAQLFTCKRQDFAHYNSKYLTPEDFHHHGARFRCPGPSHSRVGKRVRCAGSRNISQREGDTFSERQGGFWLYVIAIEVCSFITKHFESGSLLFAVHASSNVWADALQRLPCLWVCLPPTIPFEDFNVTVSSQNC